MPGFTNQTEAAVLNHIFGKATLTAPTLYVALFTTAPTDDAGGGAVEVSGGGYARLATAATDWNTAVAGAPTALSNAVALTFAQATAAWGTVVGFGLYDAASLGTLWLDGLLGASKAIALGDTAEFAAGALVAKLGDPGDTY